MSTGCSLKAFLLFWPHHSSFLIHFVFDLPMFFPKAFLWLQPSIYSKAMLFKPTTFLWLWISWLHVLRFSTQIKPSCDSGFHGSRFSSSSKAFLWFWPSWFQILKLWLCHVSGVSLDGCLAGGASATLGFMPCKGYCLTSLGYSCLSTTPESRETERGNCWCVTLGILHGQQRILVF